MVTLVIKKELFHNLSGAVWPNLRHFQGKTELERPSTSESCASKNRYGAVFAISPGNDCAQCETCWG